MRLSRFYSDQPDIFAPVEFVEGLNVVLAEIRLPENRQRDTHNLGKTTLGRLLDFGFLAGRDSKFFLFRYPDLFDRFVFFLELELEDGTFLTIRRSVAEASRIAFKKALVGGQDFSGQPEGNWDHWDVPFDRAKELLDSLLDWRALKPWPYRKGLGYFLRSQDDFRDVFQLRRFANVHADWKPFLAHLLGFDGDLVSRHYAKEDELAEKVRTEQTIQTELGGTVVDVSKIEGMLLLKQQDLDRKQALLDAFDFRSDDKEQTRALVDKVDLRIAHLNGRRYTLQANKKKIDLSLKEDQILFSPEEAKEMFAQAGVLFEGQIKRDFEQLLSFNRAITEERQGYLEEERSEIEVELKAVGTELAALGKQRSEMLRALSDTDAFLRYKHMSANTVALRADIATLERQRGHLQRLQELRHDIRTLSAETSALQEQVEQNVEAQNREPTSRFSQIRLYFNEVIEEVLDRKALLSVFPNTRGHLEFRAEILDEGGNATSADLGFTYRELLCVAFDLAVLRVHLGDRFPRFAYHDGVLESLDDRKKENLLAVLRAYADLGLQSVITLIDSDLPARPDETPVFEDAEIVVRLHDMGEDGRLFRMASW